MPTISFCFDDGFRRSAVAIREVFERRGLKACFAILADPRHALDPFVRGADLADWRFWRDVMRAGHEVAAHGLMHERYDELDFEAVKASVLLALQEMEARLPGFRREESVFHVPYLSAPRDVVQWLGTQSSGVRLGSASGGFNRWADITRGGPIDCICFGPDGVADSLASRIRACRQWEGWLVLVLHGVDGEGWGPVSRQELERLLDDAAGAGFTIAPPNAVLAGLRPGAPRCPESGCAATAGASSAATSFPAPDRRPQPGS